MVEPGRVRGSGGVDKLKTETGICVVTVQDGHLERNLGIGDISALQGIVLGDDMDYVDSEHQLQVLRKGGIDALLHATGMVICLAAGSLFKALRPAKRSSALVMLSWEITVLHLETSEGEHSAGESR